jgi:hypothetical protein
MTEFIAIAKSQTTISNGGLALLYVVITLFIGTIYPNE